MKLDEGGELAVERALPRSRTGMRIAGTADGTEVNILLTPDEAMALAVELIVMANKMLPRSVKR